ncbi:hypothetical protein [Dyella sp. Tek66A03]|jgi:hypothetical protein
MARNEPNETLDLEMLETRLEMESMSAAVAQSQIEETTPICICHF